jgi:hypothetical protein
MSADLRSLPFRAEVAALPANAEGVEAVRAATVLRDALVARLRAEIAAAPGAAFTWLMQGLDVLPDLDADWSGADFNLLTLQQLYLAAVEHGPLDAFVPPVEVFPPFWREPVVSLLQTCTALSMALREAGIGVAISLRNGVLEVGIDPEATWAAELNLYGAAASVPDLYTGQDAAEIRRIEREAYEDSPLDLLDLFTGDREIRRRTRVLPRGEDVLVIDVGPRVDPALRRMVAACTLDLDRVRRQPAPAWGPTAGAAIHRSVPAALAAATAADWLNYAPILSACEHAGNAVNPVAITSGYLLHRAATKAAVTVSYRLSSAAEAARRRGPIPAKRVDRLVAEFHRRFERVVADRVEAAGFRTCHGLEKVGAKPIACGEIDVIGYAEPAEGPPIVVVAEVKNNDLTLAKDLAAQQAWALMGRAHRQARVKAGWVHDHWAEVAPLLGAAADRQPNVLALVVTRLYPLPTGEPGVAFLASHELEPLLGKLRTEPASAWRPDLRSAVIPSGRG